MGWIKREADEHTCKKPRWTQKVSENDIWQCDDCNLKWRVAKVTTWDDQRDPGPYGSLEWAIYVAPSERSYDWRD